MGIVERLRSFEVFLMDGGISPVAEIAAQEIERLREDKAELLKALTDLWSVSHWPDNPYEMDAAKLAIVKATGGEK